MEAYFHQQYKNNNYFSTFQLHIENETFHKQQPPPKKKNQLLISVTEHWAWSINPILLCTARLS